MRTGRKSLILSQLCVAVRSVSVIEVPVKVSEKHIQIGHV